MQAPLSKLKKEPSEHSILTHWPSSYLDPIGQSSHVCVSLLSTVPSMHEHIPFEIVKVSLHSRQDLEFLHFKQCFPHGRHASVNLS